MNEFDLQIAQGRRFKFGKNWAGFLTVLDNERIAEAEKSLTQMLEIEDLKGKNFLDIGSGSGLLSLAAKRLGARVYSFDYDPHSVACTIKLKRKFFPTDGDWKVEEGSVVNRNYMKSIGKFDIVYSWGVLHHTGNMWQALENTQLTVDAGGRLFISIYNDQGWISLYWKYVKKIYNKHVLVRVMLILIHMPYLFVLRGLVRACNGRFKMDRGMSLWYDMIDWLGGYPFETAKPEEVCEFCRLRGFVLLKQKTCGRRSGCNEFIFERKESMNS